MEMIWSKDFVCQVGAFVRSVNIFTKISTNPLDYRKRLCESYLSCLRTQLSDPNKSSNPDRKNKVQSTNHQATTTTLQMRFHTFTLSSELHRQCIVLATELKKKMSSHSHIAVRKKGNRRKTMCINKYKLAGFLFTDMQKFQRFHYLIIPRKPITFL